MAIDYNDCCLICLGLFICQSVGSGRFSCLVGCWGFCNWYFCFIPSCSFCSLTRRFCQKNSEETKRLSLFSYRHFKTEYLAAFLFIYLFLHKVLHDSILFVFIYIRFWYRHPPVVIVLCQCATRPPGGRYYCGVGFLPTMKINPFALPMKFIVRWNSLANVFAFFSFDIWLFVIIHSSL